MRKKSYWLFILPLAFLILWAVLHAGATSARADVGSGTGKIVVNGTAVVQVTPDQALVTFGAQETATHAGQAQDALSRDTRGMMQALAQAGIDQKEVETTGYSISPTYDNNGKLTGYQAQSSLTVTVKNLDSLGHILEAVVAAGGNQVSSIQFKRSDMEAYKKQALQKAVADAMNKAGAIAAQLGKALGPVEKVTENDSQIIPVNYGEYSPIVMKQASMAPDVQPGQLNVSASVTLTVSY